MLETAKSAEEVRGAVWGVLCGWTLGSARRGRTVFSRLTGYEPLPRQMAAGEALDAWHVACRPGDLGCEGYGGRLFEALGLGRGESAFGGRNVRAGFGAPLSGRLDNPLGEGSEGLTRALVWGLVCRGDVEEAGRRAFWDVSSDHWGEGVWLPVALAGALAGCRPGDKAGDFVRRLGVLAPPASQVHRVLPLVSRLGAGVGADGVRELRASLPGALGLLDEESAVLTLAWALAGLVAGDGEVGRSMLLSAGCGGAADHAAAVAGGVAGFLAGSVAEEWREPLGEAYVASHAFRGDGVSGSLSEFVEMVAGARFGRGADGLEEAVVEGDGADVAVVEAGDGAGPDAVEAGVEQEGVEQEGVEVGSELAASALEGDGDLALEGFGEEVRGLLGREGFWMAGRSGENRWEVEFLEEPRVGKGSDGKWLALSGQVRVWNLGEETRDVGIGLGAPDGWGLASRAGDSRLAAGGSVAYAFVLQPGAGVDRNLRLSLDEETVLVPVSGGTRVWVAGPFDNIEDQGYEHAWAPERSQRMGDAMAGRSGLRVRWTESVLGGCVWDVEPFFAGGPGVVYLYGRFRTRRAERLSLTLVCGTGVKVWADGRLVLRYQDYRSVSPRGEAGHTVEIATSGEVALLVKVVRKRDVVPPLIFVLRSEEGEVLVASEVLGPE